MSQRKYHANKIINEIFISFKKEREALVKALKAYLKEYDFDKHICIEDSVEKSGTGDEESDGGLIDICIEKKSDERQCVKFYVEKHCAFIKLETGRIGKLKDEFKFIQAEINKFVDIFESSEKLEKIRFSELKTSIREKGGKNIRDEMGYIVVHYMPLEKVTHKETDSVNYADEMVNFEVQFIALYFIANCFKIFYLKKEKQKIINVREAASFNGGNGVAGGVAVHGGNGGVGGNGGFSVAENEKLRGNICNKTAIKKNKEQEKLKIDIKDSIVERIFVAWIIIVLIIIASCC